MDPYKVRAAAFSPDGRILAVAVAGKSDASGEIKLWDARTGQELASLQDDKVVLSVTFSPDGKILASANKDGTIKLWATEVLLAPFRK
jgi:WD40 repeat protein